jgi:hypothetical protein
VGKCFLAEELPMLTPGTKIIVIKHPYVPAGSIGEVTSGHGMSREASKLGCMARVIDLHNRVQYNYFMHDEFRVLAVVPDPVKPVPIAMKFDAA